MAIRERIIADAGHTIGNRDPRKAGAIIECRIADAGHTIGNGDAGKAGATIERIRANAGHTIGNGDAGKAGAIKERFFKDGYYGNAIDLCRNFQFSSCSGIFYNNHTIFGICPFKSAICNTKSDISPNDRAV